MNAREKSKRGYDQIKFLDKQTFELESRDGHSSPHKFAFDNSFAPDCSQEEIYKRTAEPMLKELFNGYNVTIFAYGQTGSGKTHTMMGDPLSQEEKGIIPQFLEGVFYEIDQCEASVEFTVKLSYVEIYNEKIRDLIIPGKDNMKIRQDSASVWVEDVYEQYVNSFNQVLDFINKGQSNRAMASTGMNDQSSRSHSVLIMTLGQHFKDTGVKKGAKLFLVDLAGSEKIRKTGAAGQTLKEAQHINKSLSALGNVINSLTSKKTHIPYRDSKLTRLLSDSLGGNSKTCLVVTCSPSSTEAEETLSTSRFGSRAKEIKNKPTINEERGIGEYKRLLAQALKHLDVQKRTVRTLKTQVERLKQALLAHDIALPDLSEGDSMGVEGNESDRRPEEEGKAFARVAEENEALKAKIVKLTEAAEDRDRDSAHLSKAQEQRDQANTHLQQLLTKFNEIRSQHVALAESKKELEQNLALVKQKLDSTEKDNEFATKERDIEKQELTQALSTVQQQLKKAKRTAKKARSKRAARADGDSPFNSQNGPPEGFLLSDSDSGYVSSEDEGAHGSALDGLRKEYVKRKASMDKKLGESTAAAPNKKEDMLMSALQQKCEQYIQLQVAHQGQKEYLKKVEVALQTAEGRAKLTAVGPERKIRQLEEKCAAAENLCKKLLESGMYWRAQRKNQESVSGKIVIPIKGGGKGKGRPKSSKAPSKKGNDSRKPRRVAVADASPESGNAQKDASKLDKFF